MKARPLLGPVFPLSTTLEGVSCPACERPCVGPRLPAGRSRSTVLRTSFPNRVFVRRQLSSTSSTTPPTATRTTTVLDSSASSADIGSGDAIQAFLMRVDAQRAARSATMTGDPSIQVPRVRRGTRRPQAADRGDASGPSREMVKDDTQGVQLATMQKLADYWANQHDWRRVEAKLKSFAPVRHQHRRRRHPLHPGQVEAPERIAGDHHTRLARLDHRADEDHRAADRSRPRMAGPRPTRSTSSFRRSRATAFRASPPSSAGIRSASRAPGPC